MVWPGWPPAWRWRAPGTPRSFSFGAALATAPHDDHVLRRTVGRIGLLDRLSVFDGDTDLHDRIERIWAGLTHPSPAGPPREELLRTITSELISS